MMTVQYTVIIEPADDRYDAARVVWNGMFDRRPALVVRPTGQADVISAVRTLMKSEV